MQLTQANVKATLFRILDEPASNRYDDLISRAVNRVESMIGDKQLSASEKLDCEYAAAVLANYERACEYSSREQMVMSERGAVHRGATGKSCIEAAARLRDHAFAMLEGVIGDPVFIFATIGADTDV